MTDHLKHRSGILQSIRKSLGVAMSAEDIALEYAAIPRTYKASSTLMKAELLDLLEDRLQEYDAGVYRVSVDKIASSIAMILGKRSKRMLAIPSGIPTAWLPSGVTFADAANYDAYRLDKTEGLLSGCTVAVAETGSIILQNAAAQGPRILSLVPDYHLCVVFAEQVVETVPEAFERLRATATLPTTFISGPSATADIEMTRIKGVHGPRFLDVLIVV